MTTYRVTVYFEKDFTPPRTVFVPAETPEDAKQQAYERLYTHDQFKSESIAEMDVQETHWQ